MAAKNHRYETKLRHCHPVYNFSSCIKFLLTSFKYASYVIVHSAIIFDLREVVIYMKKGGQSKLLQNRITAAHGNIQSRSPGGAN